MTSTASPAAATLAATGVYVFDPDTFAFVAPNGKLVAPDVLKAASEMMVREAQFRFAQDALDLQDGRISRAEWLVRFERQIKVAWAANGALGYGGWEAFEAGGIEKLRPALEFQLERAAAFAKDIADGRYGASVEMPGFRNRVMQYANQGRVVHEQASLERCKAEGALEARLVRAAVDSCQDCIDGEAQGWVPIDEVFQPGSGACRGNCHCITIKRRDRSAFVVDAEIDARIAAAQGVVSDE